MTVINAPCEIGMQLLDECSVDAIVTDPPYELGFMGRAWDKSGIANNVEMWRHALRVLKPGGHLLAFSGTRTYHRMGCAIEDAGFEIRDQIGWAYGTGFPKSLDVSKAIDKAAGAEREVIGRGNSACEYLDRGEKCPGHGDAGKSQENRTVHVAFTAPATEAARQWQGWGTALKPAWEPIVVARKPLVGTVAENVLAHGTGVINVGGCRIETADNLNGGAYAKAPTERAEMWGADAGNSWVRGGEFVQPTGRWPANLIHDGSDEVLALFPQAKGQQGAVTGDEPSAKTLNTFSEFAGRSPSVPRGDTGSAARFFQQCKSRYDDDLWHALNLPPESANTADHDSSLQRRLAASVLVRAANSALPEGLLCSGLSLAPSTSATGSELKQIAESVMQATRSIAPRFWQESRPARLSLSLNHARVVVLLELTGITTITVSHWKFDGSAEGATFNITQTNLEAGAKGCGPSTASRLIYCAKASKADRGEGNNHPTVKPTDLMRYLCRLVTPPGGLVLDPFTGSGSTGKAALLEGFRFIGFELSAEYAEIARRRMRP